MTSENKKTSKNIIENILTASDALFIGVITLYSYLLSFAFQLGTFWVMGLPPVFIALTKEIVFKVLFQLFLFIILASWVYIMLYGLIGFIPKPISKRIWYFILCFVFYLVTYGFDIDKLIFEPTGIYILILFAILSFLKLIVPLFLNRDVKNLLKRLEVFDEEEKQKREKEGTFWSGLVRIIDARITIMIFSIYIAFQVGKLQIREQVEYGIIETQPRQVVLYLTRDFAICSTFNEKNRTVEEQIYYYNLEDLIMPIIFEDIGPLIFPENERLEFFH